MNASLILLGGPHNVTYIGRTRAFLNLKLL